PRLLRRVGVVDPTQLDAYRAHSGYEALARAMDIGPEAVVREVTDARLVGRGGALFPTGRKWDAVARAAHSPRGGHVSGSVRPRSDRRPAGWSRRRAVSDRP